MTTPPTPAPHHTAPPRIAALDGLRGVAVLMVFVFHYTAGWGHWTAVGDALCRLAALGWLGVDLFFVLSGFLITGILADARGRDGALWRFYVRRGLRIGPLYFVVLAVLFGGLALAGDLPPDEARVVAHQPWLWLYGMNIIESLHAHWVFGADWFKLGHFWSLSVEEHFYLVWPLVVLACPRKWTLRLCLAAVALALLTRIAIVTTGWLPEKAAYIATPCRIDGLALGAWVALRARAAGRTAHPRRMHAAAILAAALLCGIVLLNGPGWRSGPMLTLGITAAGVAAAGLVAALAAGSGPRWLTQTLESRGLRFFGKYSYAIYLFHWLIAPAVWRVAHWTTLGELLGSDALGRLAYLAIGLAASVGLALLSWRLVEGPCLAWKERLTAPTAPSPTPRPRTVPATPVTA